MTRVVDVMSTDVRTLGPDDRVDRLRDLLYLHDIGAVPVVDAGTGLVGIVSKTDVVEDWSGDVTIGTVMHRDVVTVARAAPVIDAARLMRERRIHHLVVSDDGATVDGIVSSFDLLDALSDLLEGGEAPADGCER